MRECALWRRAEVMEFLGVGRWKLQQLISTNTIREQHFRFDRKGRPTDRATFCRREIEKMAERTGLKR